MTTTTATIGPMLAAVAGPTASLAHKLVEGIDPSSAARLPVSDGTAIVTNHPTHLLGHLSVYPLRIAEMIGVGTEPVAVPEAWGALFGHGAECVDDADGSHYPPFVEVRDATLRVSDAVVDLVCAASDEVLNAELPDESRRAFWPTVGIAVNFLVGSHAMFHLGQLSTWRRFAGLGPVQ